MTIVTNTQATQAVYGTDKVFPDSFNSCFTDFRRSGKLFMVVVEWVSGVSGHSPKDGHFSNDLDKADAVFEKFASNKEVKAVWMFENDLGIHLLRDSDAERVQSFNKAFEESLSAAQ